MDFGEFTSTQVRYARSFADFEHAKLTFVHVIEPKLKMYGFAPLQEVENQLYDNAKEKLLNFCGTDPDARIVFGSAAAEIAQIAGKELFELIIMPTHGYKGIKKIFLGSTFQAVINKTNCFVLALTPMRGKF